MAQFGSNNGGGKPPAKKSAGLPRVTEPRCHVCQSEWRTEIERSIMLTHSYASIADKFESLGIQGITRKGIATHAKRHMTIEQEAVRKIVEDEARNWAENVEEHKGFLLGQKALLETGLMKAWEKMLSGDMDVAWKDVILILERIDRLEARREDAKGEAAYNELQMFMDAVKEVVPEDQWFAIGQAYQKKIDSSQPKSLEQMISIPGEVIE